MHTFSTVIKLTYDRHLHLHLHLQVCEIEQTHNQKGFLISIVWCFLAMEMDTKRIVLVIRHCLGVSILERCNELHPVYIGISSYCFDVLTDQSSDISNVNPG